MKLSEQLLSATDVGKILGVSPVRVNVLLRQGRFAGAEKIGNYWVIPREAVENFKRLPPGVKPKTPKRSDDEELIAKTLDKLKGGSEE